MEKYVEIFDNFKFQIENYFKQNVNTCSESMASSCLLFMQTEFSDLEKHNIGFELIKNFNNFASLILKGDFSSISVLEFFSDYVKCEILKR